MTEEASEATYTADETAQLLDMTPRRIRQLAADGQLQARRDDEGKWLFPQQAVQDARRERRASNEGRQSAGSSRRVVDLREIDERIALTVGGAVTEALAGALPEAVSTSFAHIRDSAIAEADERSRQAESALAVAEHRAVSAEQQTTALSAALIDAERRIAAAEQRAADLDQARNELNATYISNSNAWKTKYEHDLTAARQQAADAEQRAVTAEDDLADLLSLNPREFKRHKTHLRTTGYLT